MGLDSVKPAEKLGLGPVARRMGQALALDQGHGQDCLLKQVPKIPNDGAPEVR
jgi:hypothetical protein